MKKSVRNKKSIFWNVGGLVLLLLISAITAVLIFGGIGKKGTDLTEQGQPAEIKLYWNVERSLYYGNRNSTRLVRGDGSVSMMFSVDGSQVNLLAKDINVANKADILEVMGLLFDENGIIVDVQDVNTCAGGYAVYHYYVESVEGTTVVCNNAAGFDGYRVTLNIPEDVPIYRGGNVDLLTGTPAEIQFNDDIIAIQDKSGKIICVYVTPCQKNGTLYFNITRKYDKNAERTSREPNDIGYYEFKVAGGGEYLTVRTKDEQVATAMDKDGGQRWGLNFDENGDVIGVISAKSITGGGSIANWYNISAIDGNRFTAKKIITSAVDYGSTATGQFATDCIYYDISSNAEKMGGQVDGVRIGDRVVCSLNSRNMVSVVFILSRKVDVPMYWNVERKYDADSKSTTRTPNKDGEYEILLAVDGKQVTYKCTDKSIVDTMDARSDKHFGLKVDNGYITACYAPTAVTGGFTSSANFRVGEVLEDGTILAALPDGSKPADQWTTSNRMIGADTLIYDVSPTCKNFVGEQITTVKPGDKIHLEVDYKNELKYVYILEHLPRSHMYWNIERKYNDKTKQTTRTPNEEGYYEILVTAWGEQKIVRTKNKGLVNTIDGRADRHFGLKLDGDIILRVYTPQQVTGGTYFASWCDVRDIDDNVVTAVRTLDGTNKGKVYKATVAKGCRIYDVSSLAKKVGEPTYLRYNDRIHGETNSKGELIVIYVVDRDHPITRHTCEHITEKVQWKSWDGKGSIVKPGYYVLNQDLTVNTTQTITAKGDVVICLNGHKVSIGEKGQLFVVGSGARVVVCDHKAEDGTFMGMVETAFSGDSSGVFRVNKGGYLEILGGNYVHTSVCNSAGLLGVNSGGELVVRDGVFKANKVKGGGALICGYEAAKVTIHGGDFTGGNCLRGGIVNIGVGSTLNITGGTFAGGSGNTVGGQVYAMGSTTISGGTFTGGTAKTNGGQVYIGGNATITGGTFQDGVATENGGAICVSGGSLTISDNVLITGGKAKLGGGIYAENAVASLLGGNVENCTGTSNGGGVAIKNGTLTVSDTFKVTMCTTNGSGGAIYSYYTDFVFSGGTLTENTANEGGNMYIATGLNCTATISGGIIEKGHAKNKGGNIANFGTTFFNGGVIRDGTATVAGGNIQLFRGNTGVFTMSGDALIQNGDVYCAGVSSENKYGTLVLQGGVVDAEIVIDTRGKMTATGGTVTGKITLTKNGALELGGAPSLAQIYLRKDAKLTIISQLTGEKIPVSMETAGQFATAVNPYDEVYFRAFVSGYTVKRDGNALFLVAA